MAIDLRLPGSSAPVKCTYNLPRKVLEEFELYVEAARETNTDVSPELVLEALILDSTSARRLYYTALVRYAQAHGLLPTNL